MIEHLTKSDKKDRTDDEWFEEMWRQRQVGWNENVKEGIKKDTQYKYLKDVKVDG